VTYVILDILSIKKVNSVIFWMLSEASYAFLLSISLFLWTHVSRPNALPIVALCKIIIFILCVSALALYYETTRAETEDALVRDIAERK